METYYISFGTKYAFEPHPLEWVHPDGYLRIDAPSYEIARSYAMQLTDDKFAFMYDKRPESIYFPLGEIAHVVIDVTLKVKA